MAEQKIIEFLKINGPSTPTQLARHLGESLLFASAMLADVASKDLARTSFLKIGGGSPLYYLKEQEDLLQRFADRLDSKDRQAYELLKERKILRDSAQTPLIRMSLRQLRDFAIQRIARVGDKQELFWKWYLLADKDAEALIREILGDEIRQSFERASPISPLPISAVSEKAIDKMALGSSTIASQTQSQETGQAATKQENETEKPTGTVNKKTITQQLLEPIHPHTSLNLNTELFAKFSTSFGKKVCSFFEQKKIVIRQYEIAKKNREISLVISVPSAVGNVKQYCKVIDRKRLAEGDYALTLVEAQNKGMPGLLISSGEPSRKISERIDSLFKELNFIRL